MKNVMYVAFAAILTIAPSVSANLVTIGNIETNADTKFMTDTTTDRMYSRLDATLGRKLGQLSTDIVTVGGTWDGWSLATSIENDDLVRALLGGISSCDGNVVGPTNCGQMGQWDDGDLGAAWNTDYDMWMYQTIKNRIQDEDDVIGQTQIWAKHKLISKYDSVRDLPAADNIARSRSTTRSAGYLLFKDATAANNDPVIEVASPSTPSILAMGLIWFAASRFKKKS
jgi:hypothetical protein